MERRNIRAFRNSILSETHLETVVFSGRDIKHLFLAGVFSLLGWISNDNANSGFLW